jgi:hypothetical protein
MLRENSDRLRATAGGAVSWQIRFLELERTIVITTSGSQDMEHAQQMATEAVETATKHGAKRFLKDDRNSVLELTTVEIYGIPNLLLKAGIPRDSRVAVLIGSRCAQQADFEFFKSRMYNEGVPDVRIFTDSWGHALAWLTEEEPGKTRKTRPTT